VNDITVKTGHELEQVFKRAKQSVREKAKSTGAPLYYLHNGKRIREDANGKKYALIVDSDGKLLEFNVE
jgi:hypothetical protein